jgi:hypothetical protein
VLLTSQQGDRIEFVATTSPKKKEMWIIFVEDIQVVCDYLNTFQDELI